MRSYLKSFAKIPNSVILLLIIMVGAYLRWLVYTQGLLYDEAYTFSHYVRRPLLLGMLNYNVPNNHIFHTVLASLSTKFFGNNIWALRLPVFICGLATLFYGWKLANKFISPRIALVFVGILAISSELIHYSGDARGYIIQVLLTIISFDYLLSLENNLKSYFKLSILLFLIIYTIPTGIYILLSIFCFQFLSNYFEKNKSFRSSIKESCILGLLTGTLIFIFYVPVILINGISVFTRGAELLSFSEVFIQTLKAFWEIPNYTIKGASVFYTIRGASVYSIVIWSIIILGLIFKRLPRHIILFISLLLPSLLLDVMMGIVPPFMRVWLPFYPLILFLCLMILESLKQLNKYAYISCLSVLILVPFLNINIIISAENNKNTEVLSMMLKKELKKGDFLIIRANSMERLLALSNFDNNKNFLHINYRKSTIMAENRKKILDKLKPLKNVVFYEQIKNFLFDNLINDFNPGRPDENYHVFNWEWNRVIIQWGKGNAPGNVYYIEGVDLELSEILNSLKLSSKNYVKKVRNIGGFKVHTLKLIQ